ncbi:MAG: hypothetical protein RI560_06165 [Natronomonas sp.]|jgi:flagellin-like protein|uniref:DUF7289 family protein n=1 Tax=Natronomonas sp. TaxID=2184060 RepID=UPI002870259D|nr:hypothetical protein [Natronomonas sp.]MDR9381242.1 hypothetical protein [Natronomonas sp.]MDR9429528.1 hypothetical protein [Natronomonas sp.]
MNDRAVSSTIGVVLLLGMTIAAVSALMVVGGTVIDETRADAERSQMENAMSSFSSKASLVGLGESGNQRFSLGRVSEGDVEVRPDEGRVTLYLQKDGGSREELNSTALGAVVYRDGDTEIAYQGGGVWQRRGESNWMLSPPEYHYRLETLTFPIMTVDGDGGSSGSVRGTVRSTDESSDWYPIQDSETRSNPLENGTILVEVESRYCAGWEAFFTERSEGSITESCGADDTLVVDLTVPFTISGEDAVIAKTINPTGGGGPGGGKKIPDGWTEGTIAPSISPEVEAELESCATDGCADVSASGLSSGAYDASGTTALHGKTFNTTDGDITVVTDGDVELNDITITGSGNVTLYVRGELTVDSMVNDGGSATQLVSLVHSDGSVRFDGDSDYTGIIYAPKSDMRFNGAPAISYTGALVAEDMEIKGNINKFDFQPDPELVEYQIGGGDRPLTYLHVTENTVEIEFD